MTAIFSRSLGFADALVPWAAAGGGHLGTSALSQVLIGASAGIGPAVLAQRIGSLSTGYPGLQAASRSVINAQYEQETSDDSSVNNLLLAIIGLLASVALVNTLVVVTLQRREELAVLRRVGATVRQLVATGTCQAIGLILIGVALGIIAQITDGHHRVPKRSRLTRALHSGTARDRRPRPRRAPYRRGGARTDDKNGDATIWRVRLALGFGVPYGATLRSH